MSEASAGPGGAGWGTEALGEERPRLGPLLGPAAFISQILILTPPPHQAGAQKGLRTRGQGPLTGQQQSQQGVGEGRPGDATATGHGGLGFQGSWASPATRPLIAGAAGPLHCPMALAPPLPLGVRRGLRAGGVQIHKLGCRVTASFCLPSFFPSFSVCLSVFFLETESCYVVLALNS